MRCSVVRRAASTAALAPAHSSLFAATASRPASSHVAARNEHGPRKHNGSTRARDGHEINGGRAGHQVKSKPAHTDSKRHPGRVIAKEGQPAHSSHRQPPPPPAVEEDAGTGKKVVVRSIKASDTTDSFFHASFRSRIRFTCVHFRLLLVPDPVHAYTAHSVAPWLPQPAEKSTHKRRHLRLLTGELVREHGGLQNLLADLQQQHHKLTDEPSGPNQRGEAGTQSATSESEENEGFESDVFTVPKARGPILPPLPWPEAETEMRTFFLNAKKETHKLAVVRARCRRRAQTALRALFLEGGPFKQRTLGSKGTRGLSPAELAKLVHTDYVYTFIMQPISYSASLEDIGVSLVKALDATSRLIAKPSRDVPKQPASRSRARSARGESIAHRHS